jgi:hypothetical protein
MIVVMAPTPLLSRKPASIIIWSSLWSSAAATASSAVVTLGTDVKAKPDRCLAKGYRDHRFVFGDQDARGVHLFAFFGFVFFGALLFGRKMRFDEP